MAALVCTIHNPLLLCWECNPMLMWLTTANGKKKRSSWKDVANTRTHRYKDSWWTPSRSFCVHCKHPLPQNVFTFPFTG